MSTSRVILVAEDEDNDFFLLERALFHHSRDVSPIRVRDGVEAIDYLAGQGAYTDRQRFPLPDLVLLDLKMPKRDGLEVLRWIRQQPGLKALIVVILSSSKQESDVNQAYGSGANSFLKKPNGYMDFLVMTRVLVQFWLIWSRRPQVSLMGQPEVDGAAAFAPDGQGAVTSSGVYEAAPSMNSGSESGPTASGR
jgi:CheY-like chemotaxis protein